MEDTNYKLYIVIAVAIALLVFYFIAKSRSKKGELVLTANGWDMAMLLAVPIALFIAWCWGFDHPLNTPQTVFVVVAGLCFAGTCIMSFVHNQESFGNIVISILAKLFIVLLTFWTIAIVVTLLILYLILSMIAHSPHDEYIVLKYNRYLDAFVGYRYYD